MKLELVPRLTQQQVLTPKLLLSMKVLPLTAAELEARLQQELVDNPALELSTESQEELQTEPIRLFETVRPNRSAPQSEEDETDPISSIPAKPGGLAEHLLSQLSLLEVKEEVHVVAQEIIGNLDWRGYLLFPPQEIKLSLPHELRPYFEEAFETVRSLDPAGVGAVDLKDCLLLQLERLLSKKESPERRRAYQIVKENFEILLSNRIPQLAVELNCEIEEVKEALKVIEKLSPRPGAPFLSENALPIKPDVVVEKGEYGWVVRVESEDLPKVQLSEECQKLLSQGDLDPETASFIKSKLESAQWLLQALEGRSRTLKDITEAIMEYQVEFLEEGPERIAPLRMQTVADAVGVNVSTVSRAVKGKYVETPWGIYPLRYFFSSGLPDGEGSRTSSRVIKQKIAEAIKDEDKSNPLSDGELAAKLQAQGYQVSRRTVSKYRTSMNIPPAKLRKAY